MVEKNIAVIKVDKESILKMLQFEGGVIHDVRINQNYFMPNQIEFVIEHPDLPLMIEGDFLTTIVPTYNLKEDGSLKRIDPPKKEKALALV